MSNIEAPSSHHLAARTSLKLRPKSTADIGFHYAAGDLEDRDNHEQHVYENLYVNERPSQTSTPKRDTVEDDIYDNFIRASGGGIFQLTQRSVAKL